MWHTTNPPVEAVHAILDACPDAPLAQNSGNKTALHITSAGAYEEAQMSLLQQCPEVVGKVDKYGISRGTLSEIYHARGEYVDIGEEQSSGTKCPHIEKTAPMPVEVEVGRRRTFTH
eukprot:10124664-Ditylum_brightwellii.AAC.1